MKLLDLVTSPWAILPDKLLEMQAVYATHLRGDKVDLEAIEARLGRPLANDQQEYVVRDGGVAVLPVEGILSPKMNLFTRISGGSSTQMLQTQLESAIADSRVRAIVMQIDSPGGSVFGAPEFAQAVRQMSEVKPIVAVSDGMMASAAYWIASGAAARFITGPTVHVGSIGVVATHNYSPRTNAQTTEITAGRYKRIASSNAPLSDEGQAYIQKHVDQIYRAFVDAVADNLGMSSEHVLGRMADGHVFIGQQAIDVGLVQGFATVDSMVEQLAADPQRYARRARVPVKSKAAGAAADPQQAGVAAASIPAIEGPIMNREQLEKEHPELFAQMRTEFTAAGASAELARVVAVREASLPGHEKLIEQLVADGKATGAQAAQQVIAAERSVRAAAAAAHASDAPPAAPRSAAPAAGADKTKDQQAAEAKQYARANDMSFVAALKKLGFAA